MQIKKKKKKKPRSVVKYSDVYVESKNTFRFAQSSGCRNGKLMDCKYAMRRLREEQAFPRKSRRLFNMIPIRQNPSHNVPYFPTIQCIP
jgi:hypothetical protein